MNLNEKDLDAVCGGIISGNNQMSMLNLQSLVSQRSTLIQLVTNMMQSTNDTAKTIAGNMKG
jgi:hypothetical protein